MTRFGWVAALAILAGCGSGSGANTPAGRGRRVYLEHCASCHGTRLEGKRTAPVLTNLAAHWDADRLRRYLRNPAEVTQHDPRLLHVAGRYTLRMPSFATLPAEECDDLLVFLLPPS